MAISPDTKDWTWVVERQCPQCGFDASRVDFYDVPDLVRKNVSAWPAVLERADVRARPDDGTWSALEYAAHVRDVFRIFRIRLALMLDEDDPTFANWNQDETAVADRYDEQLPLVVSAELVKAGEEMARALEETAASSLTRVGRRSDGSSFTVDSLSRYFIHDPVHHLWDVGGS